MRSFVSKGGVPIHYTDEGSGPPVVLVHGFASSLEGNWRAPGVIAALLAAGRRVVALDCRGHGRSGKPHDAASYTGTAMEDDVVALLEHLRLPRVDLVGYSMGAYVSASLVVSHEARFRSAILGGVGDGVLVAGNIKARNEAIAQALLGDAAGLAHPAAKGFRQFAEAGGNDLAALAAVARSDRDEFDRARLGALALPVMILVGEGDVLVGRGAKLAAAIPGARHVLVPGDHLTAVVGEAFRAAIVGFLGEHSPV
jgi:pimeloyl-ACP methyl ester carboxylesterase